MVQKSSSNSNRLKELAEKCGTASCLIDGYEDLNTSLLEDKTVVGITAGASAPEYIVDELIAFLSKFDFKDVRNLSKNNENVNFKLPRELQ